MTIMNRRKALLSSSVIALLGLTTVACSEQEADDEATKIANSSSDNGGDNSTTNSSSSNNDAEIDVLGNGALVFGPEDFYLTKTVVLDLGSQDSKTFYNNHVETLKKSYDDYKGIGISLVDFSDMSEEAHGAVYALNAATVAIAVFEEDKEKFWDYLTKVYEKLDEIEDSSHSHEEEPAATESPTDSTTDETTIDETVVSEEEFADTDDGEDTGEEGHSSTVPDLDLNDLVDIAIEVGASESIKDRVSEPIVEMLVRNMTMIVEGTIVSAPAVLENREVPDTVDIDSIKTVDEWLLRDY